MIELANDRSFIVIQLAFGVLKDQSVVRDIIVKAAEVIDDQHLSACDRAIPVEVHIESDFSPFSWRVSELSADPERRHRLLPVPPLQLDIVKVDMGATAVISMVRNHIIIAHVRTIGVIRQVPIYVTQGVAGLELGQPPVGECAHVVVNICAFAREIWPTVLAFDSDLKLSRRCRRLQRL